MLLGFGKASHIFDEQDVVEISAEMHEERLTPMESKQTTPNDVGNVTNLSEIHDSQISVTDLAIRADKVDARSAAIDAAARLLLRLSRYMPPTNRLLHHTLRTATGKRATRLIVSAGKKHWPSRPCCWFC